MKRNVPEWVTREMILEALEADRERWPTGEDIRREWLFAVWMWGAILVACLAGIVFCAVLLVTR